MEQATSKKYGIDYDPIYVFGQGIGQAVGFLDAAGRCRPSRARDSCRFHPALPGWATFMSNLRRWGDLVARDNSSHQRQGLVPSDRVTMGARVPDQQELSV